MLSKYIHSSNLTLMSLLARVAAARSVPVVRANVVPVALRMSHQGRPAPGPHPKEGEVLDELKQRWKKARFAKDADTATVLGVRFARLTRVFSQISSTHTRPSPRRIRSRRR